MLPQLLQSGAKRNVRRHGRDLRKHDRLTGSSIERVDERAVSVGRHLLDQTRSRAVATRVESADQPIDDRPVLRSDPSRLSVEAVAKDLGVAHVAEQAAEPPQLVSKRRRPLWLENVAERSKDRTQLADGDTRLMDVLGVIPLPDARLSLHEPFDERGDRLPYRLPYQDLVRGSRLLRHRRENGHRRCHAGTRGCSRIRA